MHTIELEISEVDRQEAEEYTDVHSCLICTALKNRGYNVKNVGPVLVFLDTGVYRLENSDVWHDPVLKFSSRGANKPFYQQEVVGLKIRMTCQDYTPPTETSEGRKRQPRPQLQAAGTHDE